MKWRPKAPLPEGCLRDRMAFLFLPMTINGETRWLERVRWCEQSIVEHLPYGKRRVTWKPISWRALD
jgi:hypothetical protein